MKKILLATNLGPTSRFALKRALLLARPLRAKLHILHVADYGDTAGHEYVQRHVDEVVEWLEEELEDEFGAGFVPTSVTSTSGAPAEAVAAAAASIGIDLVVAGISEKLSSDRPLDRTILERLLLLTLTPLLVVKSEPNGRYEKVLVGLDFGPTSRCALECALKIAPTADFVIVHATETDGDYDAVCDRIDTAVRQCLIAARREVGFLEGAIKIKIESSPVGEAMKRHADRIDPDLVAFGKHNKGETVEPYLGSGARSILEGLEADMLVTVPISS